MRRTTGSVLEQKEGVVLITTNSTLKIVHSELIMGKGIAKAAADMFPQLPIVLGNEVIKRSGYKNNESTFKLAWQKIKNGESVPFEIFKNYHNYCIILLPPNIPNKRLMLGEIKYEEFIPFRIFRDYHIILSPNVYDKRLTFGAFQTKREFWKQSPLELVLTSAERLAELIAGSEQLKNTTFRLPAPGTGYGGLDKEIVYNELTSILPDNVIWYDYEKEIE